MQAATCSRNAFNHKLSTKIVREYGAIAIEDIQIKNLARRPKPKKRKDGKGYEQNGAKRKSGLNKSFADNALGDLIAKIESKCKVAGREFIKVPAHYTTIDCSNCGAKVAKALSTRTHKCLSCGYVDSRDGNAAKNILTKGRKLLLEHFGKTYRAWAWEGGESLKRDESQRLTGGTTGVIASETPLSTNGGVPPEAAWKAALQPRDENSLQLPNSFSKDLRDTTDVQTTSQLKAPSNPCKLNDPVYEQLLLIRDLEAESNSIVAQVSCNKNKAKKRTSARKEVEGFVQLSFLDSTGAIQLEGLGML